MENYTISNSKLTIGANSFGAELNSIINNENNIEYLWCGDEKYWKRQSPILFPFVGSLKDKQYSYDGKVYPMGQHGFARDMEFKLLDKNKDSVSFYLESNDETISKYPFRFHLEIEYKLVENSVKVIWRVKNIDNKDIYFSIGGHPAFMCPLGDEGNQTDYYIDFHRIDNIKYSLLNEEGLIDTKDNILNIQGGIMKIDEHLFDNDALVIEGQQCNKVSLLSSNKESYITVSFDTPLFGIWSPAKKGAPFVCIEPWCGRCDDKNFSGSISDREYSNTLKPNQEFEKSYLITID